MNGDEVSDVGVVDRKAYWLYVHVRERWLYICQNKRDLEFELRLNGRWVSLEALKRDWNIIGTINPVDLALRLYREEGG